MKGKKVKVYFCTRAVDVFDYLGNELMAIGCEMKPHKGKVHAAVLRGKTNNGNEVEVDIRWRDVQ